VGPGARALAGVALALLVAPGAAQDEGDRGGWPVRLVDVAAEAGLVHPTLYGHAERKRFITETNGSGVALLDVDEDGWLDVLVLSGTRLEEDSRRDASWPPGEAPRNRLYRSRGDGRFEDVSSGSGLDLTGWASSVCGGDWDGDGRLDLFVTYYGRNRLFRSLGGGRFEERTAAAGLPTDGVRWGSGCSFLDYDRDGDLDLFVANYLRFDLDTAPEPGEGQNCLWKGVPVNCGPKGLPTDTNLLYRNEGDGTFTDVSEASGVGSVSGRYAMTAAAADFDGDGWLDIYVACDSTAAILYRNLGDGTFSDVAVISGTAYNEYGVAQAGMGLAVGDFDRDGRLDILKTHFADDVAALYRNLGGAQFEEVGVAAGLAVQNRHVEWGAGMPDLDNDGWADILYVTGNVYPEIERLFPRYPHRSPRVVFRNRGGGTFDDVSEISGPGAREPHSSRGAAFGDVDDDGDVDVLIMNMNDRPSLLRNDYSGENAWLSVRLVGSESNRHGLGATVIVRAGGSAQARAVLSQSSYYSLDDTRLHFGLGRSETADEVEVRWPSGRVDVVSDVAARQFLELREGAHPLPAGGGAR
jgi:hypothetical protein